FASKNTKSWQRLKRSNVCTKPYRIDGSVSPFATYFISRKCCFCINEAYPGPGRSRGNDLVKLVHPLLHKSPLLCVKESRGYHVARSRWINDTRIADH